MRRRKEMSFANRTCTYTRRLGDCAFEKRSRESRETTRRGRDVSIQFGEPAARFKSTRASAAFGRAPSQASLSLDSLDLALTLC